MTHDGSSSNQTKDAMRDIASRIEQHRVCARDFAHAQKDRLHGIEQRLNEQLTEVESRLSQWEAFQSETERQHLEFHQQRQAFEQNRSKTESQRSEVEQRETASQHERERLEQELGQRQREAEQLTRRLTERDSRLDAVQQQLEENQSSNDAEVAQLRDECERLQQEVLTLEDSESAAQVSVEMEDLRARLESALDDVHSLNQQNADLQKKLQQMPALGEAGADCTPHTGFSWEEHKQQLLSDMGTGEDDQYEPWDEKQLSIADEAIRRTDEVVARMEVQINQLRTQLDEQQELAAQAAQAASCPPPQDTSVVDDDELIQQERETLRALQEEWTEKLRRAEVEIAVERAQNARQQAELDEKMRDLQAELDRIKIRGDINDDESVQSRLMRRLGLGSKK